MWSVLEMKPFVVGEQKRKDDSSTKAGSKYNFLAQTSDGLDKLPFVNKLAR